MTGLRALSTLLAVLVLGVAVPTQARAQCPFSMRYQMQLQMQWQQQMHQQQLMQAYQQRLMQQQMVQQQRMAHQFAMHAHVQRTPATTQVNWQHIAQQQQRLQMQARMQVTWSRHVTTRTQHWAVAPHGPGRGVPHVQRFSRTIQQVHLRPHVALRMNLTRQVRTVVQRRPVITQRPGTTRMQLTARHIARPQQQARPRPQQITHTNNRPVARKQAQHKPVIQARVSVSMTCGSCHHTQPNRPTMVSLPPNMGLPGWRPQPFLPIARPVIFNPGLVRLPILPQLPDLGPIALRPPAMPPLKGKVAARPPAALARGPIAPQRPGEVRGIDQIASPFKPPLEHTTAWPGESVGRSKIAKLEVARAPALPPLEGTIAKVVSLASPVEKPVDLTSKTLLRLEDLERAPALPQLSQRAPLLSLEEPTAGPIKVPLVVVVLRAPPLPPLP